MASNCVTGIDVEHFYHASRFSNILVLIFSLPLVLVLVRFIEHEHAWWLRFGAGFFIAFLSAQVIAGLANTREFLGSFVFSSIETQKMSGTLHWLTELPEKDVVLDSTDIF